ncbi:capsular exopolysaccharide synthesis family protein [Sphingopyxis panaciterrae]|uniref:GumC family protein n=1 Tax=Sphingopyxis panaciterrae TaxID=363841 RepID=UPI00141F9F4E|nr:polysaccharide biosynthesis tyrosine autokinase [Sphingopyxis panaciterrae]NIJ36401.1 capsular exopolysaccharide synthesis family protein [Sphingopyxis panaciterrae]
MNEGVRGAIAEAEPVPTQNAGDSDKPYSLTLPEFEKILAAVIQHRYWVLGAIVVALLLGLLATTLATPEYTSTARIEVLPDSPVDTSVPNERDRSAVNEIAFYNTQYSLLKSESLAERVVRAGNLTADEDFVEAFGLGASDAGSTSAERRSLADKAADTLLNHLSVEPVRTSSLIDISFSTPSPQLSAKLADLWVAQFVQATIDRRFAATSDARKYLEARLEALRRNLETSERALINYSVQKGIVTLSSGADASGRTQTQTLVATDIAQISTALAKARETRIIAEAQRANTMTGVAQVNAPTVGAMRQQRATLEAELAKVRTLFADDYPTVISLRAQIANLDKSIAAETNRSSQSNREAYDAAVKTEQDLQSELDALTGRYNSQQRESIEMAIMQREVDSNRQLYEGLLQRYKEIGVVGVGTNNVSLVDRAKAARVPSSPNLLINLAIALLAGIAVAAGIVFLLEKLDSSIRDPQEVSPRFGLPLLGEIPEASDRPIAEAITDKKSAVYEAYFSLMTNLTFLTEHGAPRSVMLTSSQPQEGKSNSSLCLATVLAATGKSVILVDADVRNPSLNRYLEIPDQRGLSHYLSGDNDLDSMIAELPRFGFSILTAGKTPPNAAELLGSDRLSTLIQTLLGRYDHVLIDSPPLLGLADAPLIARRVEGVLFVIEASTTRNRSIAMALTRLRMSGAKLFGAIVTKIGVRNQLYGYGYRYGYGYSYGADKSEGEERS